MAQTMIGFLLLTVSLAGLLTGCSLNNKGNVGKMSVFPIPETEAAWIRSGQPLEFEGEAWYPQDTIDLLQDSEVYLLGEYKGVQFFIDKRDVRPYRYLYTKFGRNKFRMFKKKRTADDQG